MHQPDLNKIAKLIKESSYVVALTGAGVSVASGIPDFRSPQGLWSKYPPEIYATYSSFLKNPKYFWEMVWETLEPLTKAQPNPAHQALAWLEKAGILKAIITQNIDGLHQSSGSNKVVELHGNFQNVTCLNCQNKLSFQEVVSTQKGTLPPPCPSCQGILKSDVTLFGEPIKKKTLQEAFKLASSCDLLLILGTSLTVYPAGYLPKIAQKNGASIVIINSDFIQFKKAWQVREKTEEALPRIVELIQRLNQAECGSLPKHAGTPTP